MTKERLAWLSSLAIVGALSDVYGFPMVLLTAGVLVVFAGLYVWLGDRRPPI